MAMPKEYIELYNRLDEQNRKSVHDFLEFIAQKAGLTAWAEIPYAEDETLSVEEVRDIELARKRNDYVSLEELDDELNL